MPFFFRAGAAGTGAGRSGSTTFWRFGRLVDMAFADSGSAGGLGSRAGALRFRDEDVGRDAAVAEGAVGAGMPDSDELAATLAERRMILDDMSI